MVTIKYQVLFTVTIEHDYYGNSTFDDLYIIPSDETAVLLDNYSIIYRVSGNVLTAMIHTAENKPVITLTKGIVCRFFVSVRNGAFRNISSLQIIGTGKRVYYFSNTRGNKKNKRLCLTTEVPLYKDTETYETGSVIKNGNRVFECIKANSNSDQHDTTDQAFWRDIVKHQSKFIAEYTNTKTYQPGDTVKTGAKVFECIQSNSPEDKHNTADADFWMEITEIAYVTSADLVDQGIIAAADIVAYNEDKSYNKGNRVKAGSKYFEALQPSSDTDKHSTGEALFWKEISTDYIREKIKFSLPQGTFAVIDICNGLGETADFSLPEVINDSNGASFFVRFKNRSTFWKYISQQKAVKTITDKNAVYSFSNAAVGNEFISSEPVPFSKAPLTSIEMTAFVNNRNIKVTGLQNPSATQVTLSDNTSNYNIFSEIYLNY